MKNETILKKAVEKARKNGWDIYKLHDDLSKRAEDSDTLIDISGIPHEVAIFSHDFAKFFW